MTVDAKSLLMKVCVRTFLPFLGVLGVLFFLFYPEAHQSHSYVFRRLLFPQGCPMLIFQHRSGSIHEKDRTQLLFSAKPETHSRKMTWRYCPVWTRTRWIVATTIFSDRPELGNQLRQSVASIIEDHVEAGLWA